MMSWREMFSDQKAQLVIGYAIVVTFVAALLHCVCCGGTA